MTIHGTLTKLFAGVSSEYKFTGVKSNNQQKIWKKFGNPSKILSRSRNRKRKRKRKTIAKSHALKGKRKK